MAEGCTVAHNVDDALTAAGSVAEIAVIGGAQIFQELAAAGGYPVREM